MRDLEQCEDGLWRRLPGPCKELGLYPHCDGMPLDVREHSGGRAVCELEPSGGRAENARVRESRAEERAQRE